MSSNKIRIGIIGAGPAGLCQLLTLKEAKNEGLIELICFERQSDWGGLWNYTSQIGIDSFGEPIHSSMYRQLWSNNPKEIMEYSDYTFADHYGCLLPSFLPRVGILDYIIGRAKLGNIRELIQFNTSVRHVDFDDEKNEFLVEVEQLTNGSLISYKFDRIVVAIGHYHVPNMIDIDGVNQFPGRVVHSHEFRGGDEFVNLNVLIIGGGFSSFDIAVHCYKFGARSIINSTRHGPVGFKWPNEIRDAKMLIRMEGRKAYFEDGSTIDNIDAIIYCTGYRHSYPFLSKRLRLNCGITEFVPSNLFKSIFWVDQPSLAYLSVPRQIYTTIMFEIQSAVIRDVFLNRIKLPDKEQQLIEINKWQQREKVIGPNDLIVMHDFQVDYLRDLLELLNLHGDLKSLSKYDFNKSSEMFKNYAQSLFDNILNYRDISYQSFIDNKQKGTVEIDKPWIQKKDDSMDNLLNIYRNK